MKPPTAEWLKKAESDWKVALKEWQTTDAAGDDPYIYP